MTENEKVRHVLQFGPYDPAARVDTESEDARAAVRPWSRYLCLRRALEYLPNARGDKEHRKRLREVLRRFRAIGDWYELPVKTMQSGEVRTETRREWRLRPDGDKLVALVKPELDVLLKCWTQFTQDAGMDPEFSTDVDEFLEHLPEWDKARVDAALDPAAGAGAAGA